MQAGKTFIVAGTDTDAGKTVCAAALVLGFDGTYWKPFQSGTPTDTDMMRALTGLAPDRFFPEAHVFNQPLSPHRASELDGVRIDPDSVTIPQSDRTLIIEAAGGLMVPLTREVLQIDLFARWGHPVILCARTALGTINHTLLSVEALRKRNIPIAGILFSGDDNPDSIKTIATFSGARILGRIPLMNPLNAQNLREACAMLDIKGL